ncbi:MAG: hypothetical protein ACI808_001897 [Paraglaciecola sp.]|jgi:hypothetical protein
MTIDVFAQHFSDGKTHAKAKIIGHPLYDALLFLFAPSIRVARPGRILVKPG